LGQVPVGYLVLRDLTEFPDGTPSRDDLARMADVVERIALHLESAMVRQKRPASLRVIAAVPTGLNGKIQRRRLHDAPGTVLYQR
jgi:acyl-CoA synthetase (AMP-forming)/AMP-acid ligase II